MPTLVMIFMTLMALAALADAGNLINAHHILNVNRTKPLGRPIKNQSEAEGFACNGCVHTEYRLVPQIGGFQRRVITDIVSIHL
mgnify:CR=1 FL=1